MRNIEYGNLSKCIRLCYETCNRRNWNTWKCNLPIDYQYFKCNLVATKDNLEHLDRSFYWTWWDIGCNLSITFERSRNSTWCISIDFQYALLFSWDGILSKCSLGFAPNKHKWLASSIWGDYPFTVHNFSI